MSLYLSIDTEATGLEENTHLIQLALLPVDTEKRVIARELGVEWLVKCPSFEELKPNLNTWVLEHNEGLIREAHDKGVVPAELRSAVAKYMESPGVVSFFGKVRPPFLGKSLSALDIPLMQRYLGRPFMEKYFHHHTLDVTCVARGMSDSGLLPSGCYSTSKLMQYFKIRDNAMHTALSDAIDMGEIYFRLIDLLKSRSA